MRRTETPEYETLYVRLSLAVPPFEYDFEAEGALVSSVRCGESIGIDAIPFDAQVEAYWKSPRLYWRT